MQLAEYLQAPVPFVMGMPTSFLFTRGVPEALVTAVVVHLDTDTVRGMRGAVSVLVGSGMCNLAGCLSGCGVRCLVCPVSLCALLSCT